MSVNFKFYDSTGDTCTTTGTGTVTLLGVSPSGYKTITGSLSNADKVYYRIETSDRLSWEVGKGTYTTSGTTLSRDTIIASSNSGSAVNFGAGTKNVYIVLPTTGIAASVLTTAGDIAYHDGTALARLAAGTSGQLLTTNGTTPSYATIVGGGIKAYSNTSVPGGNTIASTNVETSFSSTYTLAANTLSAGDVVRLKLWGYYSTAIAPPNVTIKCKLGSTVVLNSGAITAVGSITNAGWFADIDLSFFTIGGSGTCDAQAYGEFATAATTGLSVNVPNTGTTTIDTTVDQAITITVTWSASSASNTITLRQMDIYWGRAQGNSTPVAVAQGGTNLTTYTLGDVLYASSSSVLSKLGIGSTGNVLTVIGGIPAWSPSLGLPYALSRGCVSN